MSTPIVARDLNKQAPHSPRERLAGFAIASRTVDKCRASVAGALGQYHYDCPLDNSLFTFKGITAEQFKGAVKTAADYEAMGIWLHANGTLRTAAEIKTWSDEMEAGSLYKNPDKRDYFIENCHKLGLNPQTNSTFDWLEADDRESFPAVRSSDVKDELTMSEVLDPSIGIPGAREKSAVEIEAPVPPEALTVSKTALAQIVLILLGVVAALYFARPVLLPIFIACVAGMTLKPLIRWSTVCHIPTAFSAAIVLLLLVAGVVFGFIQFSRPAMAWVNDTPQHMTDLRQRIQKLLPPGARFSAAAAALNNLGATEAEKKEEQKNAPTVQVKDNHSSASLINWTELFLTGVIETLVLLYLLLASGDLFLQKLVHVMPTLGDKKRAVEISHEIQQNISNYLLSVTLINLGLGVAVSGGLYFMGLPNAAMWGVFVAALNFVPYFGPVAGIILLTAVGLLTFETSLWRALLPPTWYLTLHLLETNLITPVLLGRRFTLNPVVIFVSLMFWTWLWGIPGALLSLPILVSIKVVSDHVPALSPVSEVLSR